VRSADNHRIGICRPEADLASENRCEMHNFAARLPDWRELRADHARSRQNKVASRHDYKIQFRIVPLNTSGEQAADVSFMTSWFGPGERITLLKQSSGEARSG